jgi:hypothetical protein
MNFYFLQLVQIWKQLLCYKNRSILNMKLFTNIKDKILDTNLFNSRLLAFRLYVTKFNCCNFANVKKITTQDIDLYRAIAWHFQCIQL